MPRVTKLEAFDAGDDVLLVRGKVDGQPVEARGWVSATTNHYRSSDYHPAGHSDPNVAGHLREGAEPQPMTTRQVRDYCRRLLLEAAGGVVPAEPPEPTRIL
jgi:methylaspartate ammonia-lyase